MRWTSQKRRLEDKREDLHLSDTFREAEGNCSTMICPTCEGTGLLRFSVWSKKTGLGEVTATEYHELVPCWDCIGGTASCCDAAGSAQPDNAIAFPTRPTND